MTVPTVRPLYLPDQSVMSHYWINPAVRRRVNECAAGGALCSSVVTMDEARFSARNKNQLEFLTRVHRTIFGWLHTDALVEDQVDRIRSALWKIGAGRGAQTTDIQIAAIALRHDATVVHNDTDFITIQRVVPELKQLRIAPEPHG